MDKLNLHTENIVDKNIKSIATLFPNTLTERITGYNEHGKAIIEYAIDFDLLRQELSDVVVEEAEERYTFTWPDKKQSILLANAPNYKTLRPCREDETVPTGADSKGNPYCSSGSVNFDTTQNLYIEGDNADVLKLLQETYLGKVKMIYIDPPYNTGKDFVYEDKFAKSIDEYAELSGEYDEDGNRMFQNSETNGRYHTDWLNMIYPRLRLAKDLLKDDGVIFISIDDYEVHNLRKICDEVFGAWNIINNRSFIWHIPNGANKGHITRGHEYILAYAKNYKNLKPFMRKDSLKDISEERCTNAPTKENPTSSITFKKGLRYDGDCAVFEKTIGENEPIEIVGKMEFINGVLKNDVTLLSSWRNKNQILQYMKDGIAYDEKGQEIFEIFFAKNGKPKYKKKLVYFSPKSVQQFTFEKSEIEMLEHINFDTPKPCSMVLFLLSLLTKNDDIILDFFSGSATTAHAVMQLNAEDGGNRKFITVQLPEVVDEKHEAFKAGYLNICEISKERIRCAGNKILEKIIEDNKQMKIGETEKPLVDMGFRVLKVDSTNMKDVYYNPEDISQLELDSLVENIKEDRTPEDLLFQVMLDLGVFLSCKIQVENISGKNVFVVYQGDIPYLIACFDNKINSEVVTNIAKRQPYYAVFSDSSIESDSLMTSFEQIFETYSKGTIRKVL